MERDSNMFPPALVAIVLGIFIGFWILDLFKRSKYSFILGKRKKETCLPDRLWPGLVPRWPNKIKLLMVIGLSIFFIYIFKSHFSNTSLDWVSLFSFLVIAPVLEELFFRGFIFQSFLEYQTKYLSPNKMAIVGLIFSTILFTFSHDDSAIFARLIGGIFLGIVYWRGERNVAYSMISHFILNAVLIGKQIGLF